MTALANALKIYVVNCLDKAQKYVVTQNVTGCHKKQPCLDT